MNKLLTIGSLLLIFSASIPALGMMTFAKPRSKAQMDAKFAKMQSSSNVFKRHAFKKGREIAMHRIREENDIADQKTALYKQTSSFPLFSFLPDDVMAKMVKDNNISKELRVTKNFAQRFVHPNLKSRRKAVEDFIDNKIESELLNNYGCRISRPDFFTGQAWRLYDDYLSLFEDAINYCIIFEDTVFSDRLFENRRLYLLEKKKTNPDLILYPNYIFDCDCYGLLRIFAEKNNRKAFIELIKGIKKERLLPRILCEIQLEGIPIHSNTNITENNYRILAQILWDGEDQKKPSSKRGDCTLF